MVPAIIYGVVPLLALSSFVLLCPRMRDDLGSEAPVRAFFFLFAAYGGLLLVVLTDRFWSWSAMASIGTVLLLLAAPLLAFQAWKLRPTMRRSNYHRIAATLSWAYPLSIGALVLWASTSSP